MNASRPLVLLVQLPIPPPGPQPIRGNVPLAAAYLKLFARRRGWEEFYRIELFPSAAANTLGDQGLVEGILSRQPWMVGFTCYLWNVERALWIADQLKQFRPDLKVVLGGPELTGDNAWVVALPAGAGEGRHQTCAGPCREFRTSTPGPHAADYGVVGEGEQTFAGLLGALQQGSTPAGPIPGLWVLPDGEPPSYRAPLASLDEISSPYPEGILDAADEQMMLLETARGCAFRCKFCYYPKSYDGVYFLSADKIRAALGHAADRGAKEVVLLDPTLNQRRDFAGLLRLLAQCNPQRRFTYSGELRSEGINAQTARLLREANFTEVEIGLQSVDPHTQELMDRKINLKAFQRGTRAMLDAGIKVRVDLILGLPGDTVDSVRRSIDYLQRTRAYSEVQVFNLSILPGTAFRQDARQLGLVFQPRPPYYVLGTPTLRLDQMVLLSEEAQDAFGIEFDPLPPPVLDLPQQRDGLSRGCQIDLDRKPHLLPPAARQAQAFTLWLRSADFQQRQREAASLISRVLEHNPHTTLQTVLQPTAHPEQLSLGTLETLLEACFQTSSYLDRYYSLHPGRLLAAKRLIVLVPFARRAQAAPQWIRQVGQCATLVWQGGTLPEDQLEAHEYVIP